ncbi:MAG: hypothetical protein MZW92_03640 [Comamonadaceae bacterium]|nr:hypothetical protein [Comamonadaceae bacterium]
MSASRPGSSTPPPASPRATTPPTRTACSEPLPRKEIAESVAATLYSVWRGQFIRNSIDATLEGVPLPPGVTLPKPGSQLAMTALKALLERPQPGVGASGINFFNAPAAAGRGSP